MGRERIEGLLDQFFIGQRTCGRAKPGEPRRALRVSRKETVQIGPGDPAIHRHRAVHPAIIKPQQRALRAGACRSADMHFIS